MVNIGEFFLGGKDKIKQATTQTDLQKELSALLQEAIKSGTGPLKELFGAFNPEEFQKGVANPAIKQFQEEILPSLQEKFIARGTAGGSGYNRALTKGTVDLQSRLAELMYGAQNQQKQNQIQGVNTALGGKNIENIYQQGRKGVLPPFLEGLGQGVGKAAGAFIAG